MVLNKHSKTLVRGSDNSADFCNSRETISSESKAKGDHWDYDLQHKFQWKGKSPMKLKVREVIKLD